jgi:hypothetical protein
MRSEGKSMSACACQYDEYEIRTEVCGPCAAGLDQRTRDWYQARCGFATGSKTVDLSKKTKTGWSAKRFNYKYQLVVERLTGNPQGIRFVKSLDERAEMEPEARKSYAFYYNYDITLVGFLHHPTIDKFGCSPDGLIGAEGMMEIKCLDAAQHIKLLEGGPTEAEVLEDYWPQIESGLSCTKRNWCDFVSYCPTMKDEDLRMYVRHIERKEDRIIAVEATVTQFLEEVAETVERVKKRGTLSQDGGLLAQLTGSLSIVQGDSNVVPIKTKRRRTAVE